jgi:kynurenine formamidase
MTQERSEAAHLHWRQLPRGGYEAAELGATHDATAADVLGALSLPTRGHVYDLDCGRWPGMPVYPAHPPFMLVSYRTPSGLRVDQDVDIFRTEQNADGVCLNTEMLIATMHTGTHIDALNHIGHGEHASWYGGYADATDRGDFGTKHAEASSIAPFVCRGVLVDLPAFRGVDMLAPRELVTADDLIGAVEQQGTELRRGDAVLIRTGYIQSWGTADPGEAAARHGAGITLDAAVWLGDRQVALVGADTEGVERIPSPDPDNPHPVHVELLVRRGVHLLEMAYLEDLARDRVFEFLFVCLPLRVVGATGSMVRPIAIA